MFESLFVFLHETLVPIGAAGIFLATVIEAVVAPLPSALVLYASGFIFLSDVSGLEFLRGLIFIVAIPAALGASLGSFVFYGLGYYFGKAALTRYGQWLGVTWRDLESLQKKFNKGWGDEITLGLLRAVPIIPNTALTLLAGIIRMRPLPYFIATFVGLVIRGSILAFLGAKAGTLYLEHMSLVDKYENVIMVLITLATAAFFVYRHTQWRKRTQVIQ